MSRNEVQTLGLKPEDVTHTPAGRKSFTYTISIRTKLFIRLFRQENCLEGYFAADFGRSHRGP